MTVGRTVDGRTDGILVEGLHVRLGFADGEKEGFTEGVAVIIRVGVELGSLVGGNDGFIDGRRVGFLVGLAGMGALVGDVPQNNEQVCF